MILRAAIASGARCKRGLNQCRSTKLVVLACQLSGLALAGKYRQEWRSFGAAEFLTILRGIAFGVAGSVLAILYLYRFEGFSRTVFALDAAFLARLVREGRLSQRQAERVAVDLVDAVPRKAFKL